MKIKYSPCSTNRDTIIKAVDDNTIRIDGTDYEFDTESVTWPEISEQTDGAILEAHREAGDLYVTVLRFYSGSCTDWDTGAHHAVDR